MQSLEKVLDLPDGWLAGCLPVDAAAVNVHEMLGANDILERAIAEHGLARGYYWHEMVLCHTAEVGADRADKEFLTEQVKEAVLQGAQRWTIISKGAPATITGEGLGAARHLRTLPLAPDLVAMEFGLDKPLARGQQVHVRHRVCCPDRGDTSHEVQVVLARSADLLTLQTRFEGDMPESFTYGHQSAADGPELVGQAQVQVLGDAAMCVILSPQSGCHSLRWVW